MKKPSPLLLVCAAVLLFGIFMSLRGGASRTDVIQKVFRNQEVFDAFLSSRDVTAQRLHLRPKQGSGQLTNYDHSRAVPVTPAHFRKIQRLLSKPSSYDWGPYAKGCIVDYGVLFTFRSGKRPVRVAFCFNCNWLGVFEGDDESASSINTEGDFDPIRKSLVAIVKSIYPDDSEIQGLR